MNATALQRELDKHISGRSPWKNIYRVEHPGYYHDNGVAAGLYAYVCQRLKSTLLYERLCDNEPRTQLGLKVKTKNTLPVLHKVKRPGIWEDSKLRFLRQFKSEVDDKWGLQFFYGFSSLDQLYDWFFDSEERIMIRDHGFVIGVYRCKKYIIGDKQSLFIPEDFTRSHQIDIQ